MSGRGELPPVLKGALDLLRERPSLLEPGVRLLDGRLTLEGGVQVPLHGVDPLGHPVLVFPVVEFEPQVYDRLLEVVARLHAEPMRFAARFGEPERPRMFLLSESIPRRAMQRLELLGRAFPLRAFTVTGSAAEDGPWRLQMEYPGGRGVADQALQALPGGAGQRCRRLLQAAAAISPPLVVTGGAWPCVFHGRRGPYATLHCQSGNLWLARAGHTGHEIVELADDQAVDLAIDFLLREQWQEVAVSA